MRRLAIVLPLLGAAACATRAIAPESLAARAERLHRDAIVIDTHSDTTPYFQDPDFDFTARHPAHYSHMDLPRIREGGLDVEFWSIYLGRREGDGRAIREALQRIDAVHRMVALHPEVALATSVAEVRTQVAAGRFVSMMGIEGGHIIEDSLPALRDFYRLGVRYLTLTHSFHTSWADSSGTAVAVEPLHGGLTDRGRIIVGELNRIGMMVDVSHVSDATFYDVIETTRAPVLASHSSVRAVASHVRNLSDDMLRALADNGGVVMINFYSAYLDEAVAAETAAYYERWGPQLQTIGERHEGNWWMQWLARREHYERHPAPQTTLPQLLDHFDHAIAVAGADHVGVGADWDGVASFPRGLDDVSLLPQLTRGLLERGHSEEVVRKVLGENLLRVLGEVETVAAQLQAEDPAGPLELEPPPQ
ncbi:MAG: dipeptidase [Myxococcota bacterium]|nr:dipeptidase [Myxococcota bacterium]